MSLIAVYGGVLVLTWILSEVRTESTLLRGSGVLVLNGIFLAGEVVRLLRTPGSGLSVSLVVFGLTTAGAFLLRDWWLLSRFDGNETRAVVEQSLRRLRIEYVAEANGYAIRVKSTGGRIELRPLPTRRAAMRITSETPAPKVTLLRSLLVKRFGRLVPRPRVRLR
jgi:hypothetical protein